MACHVPRATHGRDHTERDADRGACAGNAANYQTPVFNVARTWDQFTLISIVTAPPRRQFPGQLSRMRLSRHVWRKAARLSSVAGVLHGPRENAW